MKRASYCVAASLLCASVSLSAITTSASAQSFVPVTDSVLASPDPADWLMINRTYDAQRFSPLNQITKSNVGQLRMAWSRGLGIGTQESTPIVYRGVMYLYAPGASIQAVNATNGDLIWEYQRDYPKDVTPAAARNKSIAIYDDMIFFAAPDGFLVGIDAQTGKQRWQTKVDNGGQTAGGMIVADGKVITNRTCEQSKRENCFIAAHDAKTGKEVWKFFVTAAPGELGGDTWANMPVDQRAAGPWGLPGSYDPKKKMLYWGVANPNPYTRLTRHGSADAVPLTAPVNLFSNSTLALDVQTGKLQWYYQELPGDDWDADHNQERILVHTKVSPDPKHVRWISSTLAPGEERDVIVTVAEGGGMFMIDQNTGQFLWSRPFPYDDPNINMNDIDLKTGQTRVNPDKLFRKDGDKIIGCYHNTRGLWSIAYHPGKNSVYVPFQDQCLSMTANTKAVTGWGPRTGVIRPGSDPNKYMNIGKLDLTTGELKVLYSQPQASSGSALVTAGDLIFWGDQNRRLRAFDADDGKVLWESVLGGMIMNSTISYAVNGKQYVMVFTGEGQSVSAGPLGLTRNTMPRAVRGHNSIFVFALP
jgi:PQQ-dependent dehydrogenase (methanol/ethanol family)